MNGPKAAQVSKLPLVLLGLMSIVSFGGPFALAWILSGGREQQWPPDRPVEWVALIGTVGLCFGLMVVLLVLGLANIKAMKAEKERLAARNKT